MGRGLALLGFAVIAVACDFDPAGSSGRDDAAPFDGGIDAPSPDAGLRSGSHLLLTEVKTGPDTLEFIEIYNPTCEDKDLSDYYLSDDPAYSLLPTWGDPTPDLGEVDAVVRFPAGAILESGAVAVIARSGTAFEGGFGRPADYALTSPAGAMPMQFIAQGANPNMTISADGEPVALFEWDGQRDLVRDVDIVIPGEAPAPGHQLVPKQVLSPGGVDGPDPDDTSTQYADDEGSLPPMLERDANDGSYARIVLEQTFETAENGNGIGGHDETSEKTRTTWEQDPQTPPTPGDVPQSLTTNCIGGS